MEGNLGLFLALSGRLDWLGNWLFFFFALVECVPFIGAVFPGGTLVSIGALMAAQGIFNVWGLTIFAIVGAVLGDWGGYALGRWGGKWLEKKGVIKTSWLAKGEEFFKKYGTKSILWGRFLGATRAVVPFIAGVSKMNQRSFFFWNILSALIWAAWNIGVGYFSGNLIATIIAKWSINLGAIISIVAVIILVYFSIKKHGESYQNYFKYASLVFMEKVSSSRLFQLLSSRQPALPELIDAKKTQRKIFAGFVSLIILIIFYFLALITDWF
jgi:undecaprenyl-diphosphatase